MFKLLFIQQPSFYFLKTLCNYIYGEGQENKLVLTFANYPSNLKALLAIDLAILELTVSIYNRYHLSKYFLKHFNPTVFVCRSLDQTSFTRPDVICWILHLFGIMCCSCLHLLDASSAWHCSPFAPSFTWRFICLMLIFICAFIHSTQSFVHVFIY